MFTGIIQVMGQVVAADSQKLCIAAVGLAALRPGDSVAVNGACLTVVATAGSTFHTQLSPQTCQQTRLGDLQVGETVNLEPALCLGEPLGGHLVSGHVDGMGKVEACTAAADCKRLTICVPTALQRYLCARGALCIDGVSLTVAEVENGGCTVSLVPYTLAHTTLGELATGQAVNLEVDQLARYVERLLEARHELA